MTSEPEPAAGLGRRKSWSAALDAGLTTTTAVMAVIGMLALVIAIAVVVGDIVWRRLAGQSFIGSVDLTQFSVMAAVSWSIPYAFATSGHVRVDLFNALFSDGMRRVLDVLANLIGAGVCGFLCWLSMRRASEIWTYGDVSQDLALPMIWYWSFLVTGLAISAVVCVGRAWLSAISERA